MTIQEVAADVLNEMFACDQEATRRLVEGRIPCNDDLADHPDVPVLQLTEDDWPLVGLLGVLNGVARRYDPDGGRIFAVYDVGENGEQSLGGFAAGNPEDTTNV
jgi:hypothetical protein